MFERDKDDLRNLGIVIEVGTFDPLFEDEAGYRIKPENYAFQLGEITNQEIALLSLAAEAWRGAALDSSALSALIKLRSIGIQSDLETLPDLAPHAVSVDNNFATAISAINSRKVITFNYLAEDLSQELRTLSPYAVASRLGYWYLYGLDHTRKAVRSFRFDRIPSDVLVSSKSSAFEIPDSFDLQKTTFDKGAETIAHLYLRAGRALALRVRSLPATDHRSISDWDLVEIRYQDRDTFIEELLWYSDDVVVDSPSDLRSEIVERLQEAVKRYG
jgi:proteasome accessory factor B